MADLVAAYGSSERHYHTLDHVAASLRRFAIVQGEADAPELLVLAIWFHDAVYDPKRTDNEERSAQWAATSLSQAGADVGDAVSRLIQATDHRQPAPTGDAALLCDVDLAVLGGSPRRFDAYERAVRAEYDWVPLPLYRTGRADVLRSFLARDRIFSTTPFQRRYEPRARHNLARSLGQLTEPTS